MSININNSAYYSNVKYQKKWSFKGYDARPLKAIVMTVNDENRSLGIIEQMVKIGEKEGLEIYFTNNANKLYASLDTIKKFFRICHNGFSKWAQDIAVLTPENKILEKPFSLDADFAKSVAKLTKGRCADYDDFIAGGNLFFVKNCDKNELFLGADDIAGRSIESLMKQYGVSKVIAIPQADFHLDMFIRPLNNKTVLVADDRLTIKEIKKAIQNIGKYLASNQCTEGEIEHLNKVKNGLMLLLKDFQSDVKNGKNPKVHKVVDVLQKNGYSPVKVPGRVYYAIPNRNEDDLVHYLNYMNAVVHQKSDGSLVFITNKSKLNSFYGITPEISEKIGFDFEKMFVKSLEQYVKKDDIYFIEGVNGKMPELLEKEGGGIHCLCNEIPASIIK